MVNQPNISLPIIQEFAISDLMQWFLSLRKNTNSSTAVTIFIIVNSLTYYFDDTYIS